MLVALPSRRYECPYTVCQWTWEVGPVRNIMQMATIEATLQDHLNEMHPGWTIERLRELVDA